MQGPIGDILEVYRDPETRLSPNPTHAFPTRATTLALIVLVITLIIIVVIKDDYSNPTLTLLATLPRLNRNEPYS